VPLRDFEAPDRRAEAAARARIEAEVQVRRLDHLVEGLEARGARDHLPARGLQVGVLLLGEGAQAAVAPQRVVLVGRGQQEQLPLAQAHGGQQVPAVSVSTPLRSPRASPCKSSPNPIPATSP
jgi:hypothetical protein